MKIMKEILRAVAMFVSLLLIILIPFANYTLVDINDTFFALNLYSFLEPGSECTTLPLFMSAIMGNWILKLANILNVNDIKMLRLVAILMFWLLSTLVYYLYSKRLGKLTTLMGLVVAACFYKSHLTIVFYTQLSQIAAVLLAICLLLAREKNNYILYVCAGFVAFFAVSIRITNIAFFSLLLLLFIGDKNNPIQWRKVCKAFLLGGGIAITCIVVIVHCTLGWPLLFKMPEAINSTSVDGHTPLMLPLYIVFGLIGPRGVFLCLIWMLEFVLVYLAFWFMGKRYFKLLGGLILCFCISFALWQCGLFHLLLKDTFEHYDLNLFGHRIAFYQSLFMCHMAIAFFVWINVFLIALAIKNKVDGNTLRLFVSSFFVGIVGSFGSNTQIAPVIFAAFFIVPVTFYGVRCWVCGEFVSGRFLDSKPVMNKSLKLSLCIVIFSICICSPLYVMTYSFASPKIPIRYFFNKKVFMYEVEDCPKLEGLFFCDLHHHYIQACVTECRPHIPEGSPLIDLSGPCANYILSAPPILKWRGGDTNYTSADSLREQLSAMDCLPYILAYQSRKDIDDKLDVVEHFVKDKQYRKIVTPHFIIWKPYEHR